MCRYNYTVIVAMYMRHITPQNPCIALTFVLTSFVGVLVTVLINLAIVYTYKRSKKIR